MKALGRNAPCWCKSGKKYKHCHKDKESQPAVKPHALIKILGSLKTTKKCSVPQSILHECSNRIVKAHTVSKSSSLKAIAKDGHVLKISVKLASKSGPEVVLDEVGINNASTFTGFCSVHDKSLFSPIEDESFRAIPLHCFLVTYRGLSKELFSKNYASQVFDVMKTLDSGRSLGEQLAIQAASTSFGGNNNLTTSDLIYIKSKLDAMLISNDYSGLQFAVFCLDSPPPIMGSSIVVPPFDFDGAKAQDVSNSPDDIPDYIAINSFSSDGKGYVVLSWLAEHSKTSSNLMRQFMDRKLTAGSLAILTLLLIENFYISPIWWNSLDGDTRDFVRSLYSQGIVFSSAGIAINFSRSLPYPSITNISMSPII